MHIDFAVWAIDRQTFWNSWVEAGIVTKYTNDTNEVVYAYTSEYQGVETTDASWNGIVTKTNGQAVEGWHTNVRVTGALVDEMTHGLNQYDQDGNLLSVWDCTWAAQAFNLTEVEIDPVTGFPNGYRSDKYGVRYCDLTALKTPSLVIA